MTYLSWYDQADFKSYEGIYKWFKTARSAVKGKPFGRWARIYQDNDKSFRVTVHNTSFLRVTPENKVIVLLDAPGIRTINNTLSANLHRMLPMLIIRTGKLHYKIESIATIKAKGAQDNTPVWTAVREGVEAFAGLTLDLTTGKFDNPKKDLRDRINDDMRRKWLQTLRKFKRGIKVRFKLGVFDKYIAEAGIYTSINWSEPQHISMLTNAIKNEDYSETLLNMFVNSTTRWYHHNGLKAQHVSDHIEHILNDNSILLRKEFGVFTDYIDE